MTVSASNALTLPQLSPAANLDGYLRAVQQFPLLSFEREQSLALKYRTLDDLDAARELVLSHLRLVVAVSRQYLGMACRRPTLFKRATWPYEGCEAL